MGARERESERETTSKRPGSEEESERASGDRLRERERDLT